MNGLIEHQVYSYYCVNAGNCNILQSLQHTWHSKHKLFQFQNFEHQLNFTAVTPFTTVAKSNCPLSLKRWNESGMVKCYLAFPPEGLKLFIGHIPGVPITLSPVATKVVNINKPRTL